MKYIIIYLPEILPLIIFPVIYLFNSEMFEYLAKNLFIEDGGNWKLLTLLNVAPIALSVKYLKDTILPKAENKVLLNWPHYGMFKIVASSVFIITLISCGIAIIFFISNKFFIESIMGLIYLSITLSSLFSLLTLIFASFKIRIIIEKYM